MPVLGVLVALPMVAYVAGTLSAANEGPREYEAIVLRPVKGSPAPMLATGGSITSSVRTLSVGTQEDEDVQEVSPRPDDLDDDSDDAGRDGDSRDRDTRVAKNSGSSSGSNSGSDDDDRRRTGDDDDDDNSGSDDDGDDDRSGPSDDHTESDGDDDSETGDD